MNATFDYTLAFSRNIGWVTTTEQAILRHKRAAIAGMGGVGGAHLLTLTRLGVGAFNLSDFDVFELPNFNRQAGASLPHLHQPKVEVMRNLARNINPELDVRLFPQGINAGNMGQFLDEVDIYIDSLDFFAVEARRQIFAACAQRGIPAVTAAPLGMGAALLIFLPDKMSFEDYFGLEGQPEQEQLLRFFLGLSPAMVQQSYLVDPTTINLAEHRGPSTIIGCELCAGVAAAQALKILLNRGPILAAPHGLHFDGYRNKVVHTWMPGGCKNPLFRLKLSIARKRILGRARPRPAPAATPDLPEDIRQILDLARWA
ncbi:MAG: ThiF family adenylyltransferase, partial [Pseudomonadota bacterium]|nr:ThiF family adenylyltransferase [Pseudomonadota bacterium]